MPAVGFAENKNQLLTRIKRIMEKSTKNYASMDRIVPALLLVIGLVCASWLTINSDKHVEQKRATIQTDTTKKKSASYSRSTIVTYDDNGKPHEQSVEEYTGDDDLRPLIAPLEIAEIVDFPLPPADVIEMQELEFPVAPMPGIFNIRFDTLPVPGVRFRNHQEVEEFGKAFQEKFREQFSDFYKSNEKEFQRMIEQLEEKFEKDIDEKDIFAWKDQAFSDAQQQKLTAEAERMQERLARDMSNDLLVQKIQAEKEMQHAQEMQRESFKAMEMSMADEQEHMKMMQSEMKLLKEKLQLFEKELKTELVKDGYIKQGEKIDNINWEDRGDSMEVNGQKIKPEHRDKYKSLHRKYFNAATHISE
jgi:hypothetical protein